MLLRHIRDQHTQLDTHLRGAALHHKSLLGTQPLKFVVTGDGSEASLMRLSAGALACIQDDGCFTLVCGDSSLCLCLTKCQPVSYSKIWQERRRVWLHILQLPYCVTDLHTTPSHCNASVFAFNICRQVATISVQYQWDHLESLQWICWAVFGYFFRPAFIFGFLTLVTI